MDEDQVFFYPTHEVVFKGPFDDLVEEVRSEEFMDISTRETCGKRLRAPSVNTFQTQKHVDCWQRTYHYITNNPILVPQYLEVKIFLKEICVLMRAPPWSLTKFIQVVWSHSTPAIQMSMKTL